MTDERSFADAQDDEVVEDDEIKSPIDSPDLVETKIVKDMAKRSVLAIIPISIVAVVLGGYQAALAVALAWLIVIGNMFVSAQITRYSARISNEAIMGGVLFGFIFRLIVIFGLALAVRYLEIIDFKVWILSVAIGHIALLAWETKYINFSLGEPGVRPKKK